MRWWELREFPGPECGHYFNDIKRKVFGRLRSVQVAVTIYITGQTAGEEFERIAFLSKDHQELGGSADKVRLKGA